MKDWTIMVYMAGDNNLSDDMITSINEIRDIANAATSEIGGLSYDADITFVLEYDTAFPIADTTRYVISKQQQLEIPKKESLSTSEAVKKLIEDCKTDYPAKKYALIISGHSDAFQGQTLLVDENPPGITGIKELQEKISEGVKALPRKKLDVLAFEGCVMNTLEVMYQFRNTADIWIGSQGSIPNYAWDYRSIVKDLITATKPVDNNEFVRIIIEDVKKFHGKYSFGGRSVDISACDLSKLPDFVAELGKLTLLLNVSLILPILDLLQSGANFDFMKHPIIRMLLSSHWKSQTFMREQAVDLFDFAEILGNVCKDYVDETETIVENPTQLKCTPRLLNLFLRTLSQQCQHLIDFAKNPKLVLKGMTTGVDFHYAKGISMFFPWSILAFLITKENYSGSQSKLDKGLDFTKQPAGKRWLSFITHFLILTERPAGNLDDVKDTLLKILGSIPTTIKVQKLAADKENVEMEAFDFNSIEEISCSFLKYLEDSGQSLEELLLGNNFVEKDLQIFDDIQAALFASEGGGTRDDHIRTRGAVDNRVFYFGRYRNLRVRDLKLTSDF